ncbi:MAG: glycosyltransferase [Oleispira sp.]|nr:glycosyltransferase [Oleispira sp.]MBL4880074.1 glycosyltransferase [Oleispira sp.]
MNIKQIKVLHVRSTIGMYGAEQVLLNILPILNEYCDAELLTLEAEMPESRTLRDLVEGCAVKNHHIVPNGRHDRVAMSEIKNLIELGGFNIIHCHDYKSLFYVRNVANRLGIPVIHHIHGALGNTVLEKIYGCIEKYMMRKVSQIFTVSMEQKNNLENSMFIYPQITQVANGTVVQPIINQQAFNTKELKLIMVARFTEEKNHSMALDLIEELKIKGIPVSLTLLGDGPLKKDIQETINSKSLNNEVKLVGFTRDVQAWLDQSDVLLITSKTEGMPMNMLEGMVRGLPVISTAVGEIPRLIKASKCGETFSCLEELIELITKVFSNKPVWKKLGLSGRAYVEENLSVEQQVKTLDAEYRKVLGSYGS